jgi:hypothetical protein
LDTNTERENYERILPKRGRKIKDEVAAHTKPHSPTKWAREKETTCTASK